MLILSNSPAGMGATRNLTPNAPTRPATSSVTTVAHSPAQQGLLFGPSPALPPAPSTARAYQAAPAPDPAACVRMTGKGTAITTSRYVAECFNKEHKHVLRDIREIQGSLLELDEDETAPCFAEHFYKDSNNQPRPEIIMTKRGFMLLAMGFTGKEAMQFKIKFLDAFEHLQRLAQQPAAPVQDTTPAGRIAQLAYYTRHEMQIGCVKQVATYVLEQTGGNKNLLVRHHRSIMKLLTGVTPSAYRTAKLLEQHKVKSMSGREMLRRFEPEKAAAAAVLDDAVRLGVRIDSEQAVEAAKALTPAFASILALGLMPADLDEAA